MGTYIMSGEKFITTGTRTSLDILAILSKWRKDQWKEEDAAEEAEMQAQFEAAPEAEKQFFWFGYQHPSTLRDSNMLNLEIFKKAQAEVPRTLEEFKVWAEKNITSGSRAMMEYRDNPAEHFTQEELDRALAAIDNAVKYGDNLHIS